VNEIEIQNVPLSVRVHNTEFSCGIAGGGEQGYPKLFRVGIQNSNGRKHSRLVTATRML
jgi:hypothetical protein